MIYKLLNIIDVDGNTKEYIVKQENNRHTTFSKDKANTDYQEYLKWLKKGNKAMEADKEKV
jgi:hypothetical protein